MGGSIFAFSLTFSSEEQVIDPNGPSPQATVTKSRGPRCTVQDMTSQQIPRSHRVLSKCIMRQFGKEGSGR
jgi:hypothetical protein